MSNAFSVLLVDDDENTQSFFQDALEHNGIQLTVASDLSSTMKILSDQHQRPDIIVLDIFLPDTDGYKLLGQIRALQQGHTCPIIAITGYYTTDTMADIRRRGFDGCLLKPIDPQELVDYLQKLMHN